MIPGSLTALLALFFIGSVIDQSIVAHYGTRGNSGSFLMHCNKQIHIAFWILKRVDRHFTGPVRTPELRLDSDVDRRKDLFDTAALSWHRLWLQKLEHNVSPCLFLFRPACPGSVSGHYPWCPRRLHHRSFPKPGHDIRQHCWRRPERAGIGQLDDEVRRHAPGRHHQLDHSIHGWQRP
jgi:hypothetical protein